MSDTRRDDPDRSASSAHRAVLLAALVVASALALAVPAAMTAGAQEFAVSYSVSQTTEQINDPVTVTATVENVGNESGSTEVTFSSDGETFATETVTLDPGQSTTVNASITYEETGTYSIAVNELEPTEVTIENFGDLDLALSEETILTYERTTVSVNVTDAGTGRELATDDVTATVEFSGPGIDRTVETTEASSVVTVTLAPTRTGTLTVSASAPDWNDATAEIAVESGIPDGAVYGTGSMAAWYDGNRDGRIVLREIAGAATDYAQDELNLRGFADVATAYAMS